MISGWMLTSHGIGSHFFRGNKTACGLRFDRENIYDGHTTIKCKRCENAIDGRTASVAPYPKRRYNNK